MNDFSRRGFLSTTGLAGFAALFPEIVRAASIPADVRTGTIRDVEHVVIFMQENRSFDHYFGTMPGVRGFSDPYPAPARPAAGMPDRNVLTQLNETLPGPRLVSPFPLNTQLDFALMRVEGTPHTWPDAQAAWDNGRMDRWVEAKHLHSMGFFEAGDLAFQYALSAAFTTCDAYHCSIMAGTNPNRLFLWSGTIDGLGQHGGPGIGNSHDSLPSGGNYDRPYEWTTYVERLQAAGIDWTIYQDMDDNFTDNPLIGFKSFQDSLQGAPGSDPELALRGLTTRGLDRLRADVVAGKLPQVSYIIATAEGSEHPGPSSPAQGAAYSAQVLDALTANPDVWAKTVLFLMYDENDGFFDHVPPPVPPSRDPGSPTGLAGLSQVSTHGEYHDARSRADAALERDEFAGRPYGLGARVPAFAISPWSRGGFVTSEVLDHTSIIRFLEARFGVSEPNISPWRRAVCGDMMSAFDFEDPNGSQVPSLPDPSAEARRAAALGTRTVPPIPQQPELPRQAAGSRPRRASLYDPHIAWDIVEGGQAIRLAFHNNGARAIVFHVYDRHDLDAIPRRYTIAPGERAEDRWTIHEAGYDLQVMGPDNFHRRLAGTGSDRGEAAFDRLGLRATEEGLAYRVAQDETTHDLPAGIAIPVAPDGAGSYDITVISKDRPGFLRQFAGRLPAGR